jgi:hypothetical protein
MGTKYRDLYKKEVKGALPTNDKEEQLFELAMEEEQLEKIADAVVEKLGQSPKKPPGAPRNTEGDLSLVEELMDKHHSDTRLAQNEFIKIVCKRHDITKKRGSERFRTALKLFKSRNT